MTARTAFDRRNPLHALRLRLEDDPSGPLLIASEGTFSGLELAGRAGRLASGMARIGVRKGDRVGLLAARPDSFVTAWFAVLMREAILVPINGELRGRQLEHVLLHSGMDFLISDDAAGAALLSLPGDTRLDLQAWIGEGSLTAGSGMAQIRPRSCFTREELEVEKTAEIPRVDPRTPAAILYTGGTTGPAKGVVCSHGQYYWWGLLMARILELEPGERWFTCLPFFHINAQGTFLATLLSGASTVSGGRFSASCYWDQVRSCGARVASLLGTMASILLQALPAASDRGHGLRAIFCPGISPAIKETFERRFGAPVVNAFGMTELNCVSATGLREASPAGSMGRPLPEFEVAIVDGDDEPVERGQIGELVVRPRRPCSIMSEYYRMPEATLEAWRNLWFHTGDRAIQDGNDHLYFVDRLKDCIRRRGENISSHDIETTLMEHPSVLEAAAYPVPSVLGEDDVMVSLVLRPDRYFDPGELVDWCRKRLARFAVPRYLRAVSELPKTAVGRVQKFALRATGVTADTWDREASRKS